MRTIGERIKFLRKQNNLTVQQLAELINKTKGNVSSYENDKYEPSAQTIIKICEQFNVSSDWLLSEKESNNGIVPKSEQEENNSFDKLTEEERGLVLAFREFDELDKELVKSTINNLLKRLEKSSISNSYIQEGEDVATREYEEYIMEKQA